MDRITSNKPRTSVTARHTALILFLIAALGMIAFKVIDQGCFASKEPLDLSNAPLLIFFNRHKGCECEMVVYEAAEGQIKRWTDEQQLDLPIVHVDLERRPDLGKQFDIIRAPALILVDQEGKIIFGQRDSLSDSAPFNLTPFETVIQEIRDGK